jgi:hypothetical protein
VTKFSGADEFELNVHKCFNRIFELLMKADAVAKESADKEEAKGNFGAASDMRDWIEEVILQCHLAWQYHRLSKGPGNPDTWERLKNESKKEESDE